MVICALVLLLLSILVVSYIPPDCPHIQQLTKKTAKLTGICTMIKDEEGFLAEFVSYYIVHGVNHVIFYDDNVLKISYFVRHFLKT